MTKIVADINEVALRQIERIAEKCEAIRPLVVISCTAYNHEKFLRDALDGFVMQETDFPYVAVVHEDASTDGTAAIIREYAEKYPDLILPIYEEENQYGKTLSRVMRTARNVTGAKYVALCEGDDYWTDPRKLQKQIDFLQSHPDHSMCFHNAIEHWEDGSRPDHLFAELEPRDYDYREMGAGWRVPTASAVVRKEIYDSDLFRRAKQCKDFIYGDILVWLTAVEFGKIYCTGEVMSVYRRHIGGATFIDTPGRAKQIIRHCQALPVIFGKKYKFSAIDSTVNISIGKYAVALKNKDFKTFWTYFYISLKYAPFQTFRKLFSVITDKFKRLIVR